jgi:signal transduction histidine kinase
MTSLNAGDANATMERFDAREVLNETMKRYEKAIRDKGLRLDVQLTDDDMSLVSDRAKVERVFLNVFNNAVKFTSEGEIIVKAQPSTQRDSIEIEISDTGVGIEQSKIDSIFEPFHQADNSMQRSYSGLGIGLTVARRMAELIGGKLAVTSKVGVGTRVTMSFPSRSVVAPSLSTVAPALSPEQRKYG